jgi:hypothetical protein
MYSQNAKKISNTFSSRCKSSFCFSLLTRNVFIYVCMHACVCNICDVHMLGRTMVQAVSVRPLTAQARVCAHVSPCGVCGEQSGTGTGFPPSSLTLSCQYHYT